MTPPTVAARVPHGSTAAWAAPAPPRGSGRGGRRLLKPAVWAFYAVFALEILFMISPFALHFYAAYGPTLNLLERSPATAWLTQFFLPHISVTDDAVLNALKPIGGMCLLAGLGLFAAGAVPIYWSKLRRGGPVTGGLYRLIRHPQYVGLAVLGLGALLVWPRFLVLVSFVTMLFLYSMLARWEEEHCLARFGEGYRAYYERTGRFLPRSLAGRLPSLGQSRGTQAAAHLSLFGASLVLAVSGAAGLRAYALSHVAGHYEHDVAVLSPAPLTTEEIRGAYGVAASDPAVRAALGDSAAGKLLVYVVPESWHLADLPLESGSVPGGHVTPATFDRTRYKVLFTRPLTHATDPTGRAIVSTAWGREPLVLVHVDLEHPAVTGVEEPPEHVHWGDIPTPMF